MLGVAADVDASNGALFVFVGDDGPGDSVVSVNVVVESFDDV